jgi:hypothetical protein
LGRVLAYTTDQGIAMAPDPSQTDQGDLAPQLLIEQDDLREGASQVFGKGSRIVNERKGGSDAKDEE